MEKNLIWYYKCFFLRKKKIFENDLQLAKMERFTH